MDSQEVTNKDKLYVISSVTKRLINEYHKDTGLPVKECLRHFHSSETYRRLSDFRTGYWKMGMVALLEEFEAELAG